MNFEKLICIDSSTCRDDPGNSDIEMIIKGYVTIKWLQWLVALKRADYGFNGLSALLVEYRENSEMYIYVGFLPLVQKRMLRT